MPFEEKNLVHYYPGRHCLYGSLYNLFKSWGSGLCEHDYFIMCDGLSFRFHKNETENFISNILDFIHVDYREQIKRCKKHLSLSLRMDEDRLIDWCYCIEVLKTKHPVLAFVDSSILNYHILENPLSNLGAHTIILNGVDPDHNDITFVDSYVLDASGDVRVATGTIHMERLQAYALGLCYFSNYDKDREPGPKTIVTLFKHSLVNYLSERPGHEGGHVALEQILRGLIQLMHMYKQDYYENMIALVFLMKAYFTSALSYVKGAAVHYLGLAPDAQNQIVHDIGILEQEWKAFFLRCLSIQPEKLLNEADKAMSSGLHAAALQKKFFKNILSSMS